MKWITVVVLVIIIILVGVAFSVGKPKQTPPEIKQPVEIPESNPQILREAMGIVIFDVGQGDAILVFSGNNTMLVDCGPNSAREKFMTELLKYTNHINYLVATHPDEDHIGNCDSVLQQLKVDEVYTNGVKDTTNAYLSFVNSTTKPYKVAYKGMQFNIGGVSAKVLHAFKGYKKDNDNSIVIRLDYYNTSALLTGDCESDCEKDLMYQDIDVDFLKVSHHGSAGATSGNFLDKVTPHGAYISVGDNSYGHPSPELIKRLEDRGIDYRRTDEGGDIYIVTDGKPLEEKKGDEDARNQNNSQAKLSSCGYTPDYDKYDSLRMRGKMEEGIL